jgi:ketosteroid isomerase-like protein
VTYGNALNAADAASAASLNAADAASAASLYAADGVFYPHNVPTGAGAEILGSYEQIFNTIKLDIAFTIHEIVVDGDTAFATTGSKGQVTVLELGITAPEANRELFVFVREAGDWKIGRYMFNKSTAA